MSPREASYLESGGFQSQRKSKFGANNIGEQPALGHAACQSVFDTPEYTSVRRENIPNHYTKVIIVDMLALGVNMDDETLEIDRVIEFVEIGVRGDSSYDSGPVGTLDKDVFADLMLRGNGFRSSDEQRNSTDS